LSRAPRKGKETIIKSEVVAVKSEGKEEVKEEFASDDPTMPNLNLSSGADESQKALGIKSEVSDGEGAAPLSSVAPLREEYTGSGVIFKKRKAKNIRQK